MKNYLIFFLIFLFNLYFSNFSASAEKEIYKKIDLFGEVLEKINEEYVDEVNQSESMDSAIDGLLQSLGIDGIDRENHFDPNKDDLSDWFGGGSPDWIKRS